MLDHHPLFTYVKDLQNRTYVNRGMGYNVSIRDAYPDSSKRTENVEGARTLVITRRKRNGGRGRYCWEHGGKEYVTLLPFDDRVVFERSARVPSLIGWAPYSTDEVFTSQFVEKPYDRKTLEALDRIFRILRGAEPLRKGRK